MDTQSVFLCRRTFRVQTSSHDPVRASLVAAVFTGLLFSATGLWAQDIKVGILYPITGNYSYPAKHAVQGAKLAFQEAHYSVGGKKIEIVVEDTRAPDVAHGLSKARQLVERDHVDVLMGIIWSPTGIAVSKYVTGKKVPLLLSEAAARVITQELRSPYVFRTSFAAGQMTYPFSKYACKDMGYKKVMLLSFESVFARELAGTFETGCKEVGGTIVDKMFAPLRTADYAPYLSRISAANPDAVWVLFAGASAVSFLKQYGEFGMKGKYPLLAFGATASSEVQRQVPDVSEGIVSSYFYSADLKNAENQRFVNAYRKAYGEGPAVYSAGGYITAKFLLAGLEKVNGNIKDKEPFLRAVRNLRLDTPRGPISFDKFQNAITNVYLLKAEKSSGRIANKVIHTFVQTEQYWPKGKPMK